MDESTLLNALKAESKAAIGWENDRELKEAREKALEYYKGEMRDSKVLKNRSKVVSTDVADTIETWLPDMLEIFTGGEDVVVFVPNSEEDTEAARQETDYINHVFFQKNDGYSVLEDSFLNAALMKTGIFHWYWDENETKEQATYDTMSLETLQVAMQDGFQLEEGEATLDAGTGEQVLKDVKLVKVSKIGGVRVEAVPPEDFAVGNDTDKLSDATYCAKRSEPRVQDLLSKGYDKDQVMKLSEAQSQDDDKQDRDTVGESDQAQNDADPLLRRVEIVEHYLRYDGTLFRIVTGSKCDVLLEQDEIDHIPFSSIVPFRVPHRFHGMSMADKSIEVQRVKTGLMRGMLDDVNFSLSQRYEVAQEGSTANTIPDLLNNSPASPVRSKTGKTVRPIANAGRSFDYSGAVEMADIMNERRTGVQRGQQGLNPDTLHDTASGAKILLTEGQKRTRRIARSFAETGVKAMFLGLHTLIRKYATQGDFAKLRGKWVEVNPTEWGVRSDMSIEIGVGSGGRDQEIAVFREILQFQQTAMEGGLTMLVKPENIYAAASRFMERAGIKTPESYISNPAEQEPQPQQPDPAMLKLQADQQQAQAQMQMSAQKMQADVQLNREKAMADIEMKRAIAQQQAELDRQKAEHEAQMNNQKMQYEMQINAMKMQQDGAIRMSQNRAGGDLSK